jgi:predicted acyltransferase
MEPGRNLAAWVDSILLPGRMYQGTWDPEGILSTFPAIVTSITGMVAGRILISRNPAEKKLVILFSLGFLLFLAGGAWNWVFPLNKNLWTSSFVLFTSGLAMMALAAFIWVVDVLEYKKWCEVFVIFGTNAITAYVLHGLLKAPFILINVGGPGEERNIMGAFMERVTGFGVPDQLASLSWALLFTSLCFVPVWLLYRKKIFIRV